MLAKFIMTTLHRRRQSFHSTIEKFSSEKCNNYSNMTSFVLPEAFQLENFHPRTNSFTLRHLKSYKQLIQLSKILKKVQSHKYLVLSSFLVLLLYYINDKTVFLKLNCVKTLFM